MQEDNHHQAPPNNIFSHPCRTQIQYKHHMSTTERTQVQLDNDALNLLVACKTGDFLIRIAFSNMLSIAKNTKDPRNFTLIIFVNDPNANQEEFEEFEDEEEDDGEGELSHELQILKKLQIQTSGNHEGGDHSKTINLNGCFTVTIVFNLLQGEPSNRQQDVLSQLEKQISANAKKNQLMDDCVQLYEKIVGQLNKLQDSKNGENSNKGISSLLRGHEDEEDEQWQDQQEEMDMEMNPDEENEEKRENPRE